MSNPKVGRDTGEHIIRLYAHWQELRVCKQEDERGIPKKVENSTDSKPQIIQGSQISTVRHASHLVCQSTVFTQLHFQSRWLLCEVFDYILNCAQQLIYSY
jgi:hypothetical protein